MTDVIRRIVFASGQPIYPAGWGGAETCAHDLLAALSAQGVSVRALGSIPRAESSRVRHRLETYFGTTETPSHTAFGYSVGYPSELVPDDQFGRRLREVIEQSKPDIVLTQALAWPEAAEIARSFGVPCVLYVHGAEVVRIGRPDRAPDKVLYNSLYTQAWLEKDFGLPGDVLYPATNLERHRVAAPGPAGALTLVNPLPVKGGHMLPELAHALPDRHFIAVEGWTLPPFLERLLEREPNIEVLSWQHDMRTVFSRTAVVLAPSLFEPFGRTAVEAAASGIPCVSSGAGGLREAVGPHGIYVDPPDSVSAWVAALRALEDVALYRAQAERSARWVRGFDAGVIAAKFLEIAAGLVVKERTS